MNKCYKKLLTTSNLIYTPQRKYFKQKGTFQLQSRQCLNGKYFLEYLFSTERYCSDYFSIYEITFYNNGFHW